MSEPSKPHEDILSKVLHSVKCLSCGGDLSGLYDPGDSELTDMNYCYYCGQPLGMELKDRLRVYQQSWRNS